MRHDWERSKSKFHPRDRVCRRCGLREVVTGYRYRSPRYGYKIGYRRRWFLKGNPKPIARGPVIPLPCPAGDLFDKTITYESV